MSRIPDHHGVLNIFGREVLALSRRTQRRWVRRAFEYWRVRGFPFPAVSRAQLVAEFGRLAQVRARDVLRNGHAVANLTGLRIANAFHPQMWRIPRHGRSPVSLFDEDKKLRCALRKSMHSWPNRRCWNGPNVRSEFRIYHRTRVSNFRPAVARALALRYSNNGDVIFDFSAGFGGRLLGCLTLDRHYIGIDPEPEQTRGLRNMIHAHRALATGSAEILRGRAEAVMRELPSGSVDMVMTSPPYFDTEPYSDSTQQSYLRYPTFEAWKKHFLQVTLNESHRILKRGGRLVLNVTDRPSLPLSREVLRLTRGRFTRVKRIALLLPRLPSMKSDKCAPYKSEPIHVLAKV